MILWVVWKRPEERQGATLAPKKVVLTNGQDREEAKRNARPYLLTDPDDYVVEPVINSQDELIINLTIQGEEPRATHPRHGW